MNILFFPSLVFNEVTFYFLLKLTDMCATAQGPEETLGSQTTRLPSRMNSLLGFV